MRHSMSSMTQEFEVIDAIKYQIERVKALSVQLQHSLDNYSRTGALV